ncbi:hypothetical protein L915_16143 [Phytophthora nicotianae]|uniref:Uncharacterized protein n=1 Tax=Phytophthora nicotianae TaxID=4792 RepID=W2G3N2_PHYNI|nr:hypothetical protein L915_16143 [Phytophthora nicotianae]
MVFIWFITSNDMEAIDAQKALDSLPVSVGHKATARGAPSYTRLVPYQLGFLTDDSVLSFASGNYYQLSGDAAEALLPNCPVLAKSTR